ncbi:MAG: ribonuclease HII [Lachnospiraceae bacterium]|nr:ribonuclease HII [Lachnospiraceae bacterium]
MASLTDISLEYTEAGEEALPAFVARHKEDPRSGVQKLVTKAQKRLAARQSERERTHAMYAFEREYASLGLLVGIDEVGRGPLAGPVCAGAVVLPAEKELLYLNDSKKLSEKKREELYDVITKEALAYATAFVSPARIDEINILQATYEAMTQAVQTLVKNLGREVSALLIDAVHVPQLERYRQISIVKGDAKCASVAAASIVAKVERDHLMEELDGVYPGYGFASNKGYGAAEHIAALKRLGPTPVHRRSFIHAFLPSP